MRHARYIVAAAAAVWFVGCAKVGVPPGGEQDQTGPAIVSHFPESGATNVDRHMVVELVFSEMVNRPSVESALFLSPDPILRLRYQWSGRSLKLLYLDPLEEDRTYVVSVGSEAKDLRGNPAEVTTTIAFSTGDKLDTGGFHGWLEGVEKPQSISIWAYLIPKHRDPDPLTDAADYRVQAKADGSFLLEYLKPGPYRVFAVADLNRDALWNPAAEVIGTAPWDIMVTENDDPWLSLLPALQDTSAVVIRRTKQICNDHFEIRFSHLLDSCDCTFSSESLSPVRSTDVYRDSEKLETWQVFSESELSEGEWFVECVGVDPLWRNWIIRDTLTVENRIDTTAPRLVSGWPGLASMAVEPDSIVLTFDEPVFLTEQPDSALQILSRTDTISASIVQQGPRSLMVRPAIELSTAGRYSLSYLGGRVQDRAGNALSDSIVTYPFALLAEDSLGSIVGTLRSPVGGNYLLRLKPIVSNVFFGLYQTTVGAFEIPSIPAGKYLISIVSDLNRDGKLNSGRMDPFEFSEPFVWVPDTITVRARWEYEIDLNWNSNP